MVCFNIEGSKTRKKNHLAQRNLYFTDNMILVSQFTKKYCSVEPKRTKLYTQIKICIIFKVCGSNGKYSKKYNFLSKKLLNKTWGSGTPASVRPKSYWWAEHRKTRTQIQINYWSLWYWYDNPNFPPFTEEGTSGSENVN